MSLTLHKCRVLIPRVGEAPSASLARFIKDKGLALVKGSSMELLGTRIGTINDAVTQEWLHDKVDSHRPLFDALTTQDLRKQSAMLPAIMRLTSLQLPGAYVTPRGDECTCEPIRQDGDGLFPTVGWIRGS
jgi:hypothetical protein